MLYANVSWSKYLTYKFILIKIKKIIKLLKIPLSAAQGATESNGMLNGKNSVSDCKDTIKWAKYKIIN